MKLHSIRLLAVLFPFALAGCATPIPAAAARSANPAVPIGVDLGSSARIANSQPTGATSAGEGHERPGPGVEEHQLAQAGHEEAHATGTVNSVDAARHKLNISHSAIPEIGWPAMTMEFPVAPSIDLASVKPGSRMNFTIEKGRDGMYQVQSLQPASGAQ